MNQVTLKTYQAKVRGEHWNTRCLSIQFPSWSRLNHCGKLAVFPNHLVCISTVNSQSVWYRGVNMAFKGLKLLILMFVIEYFIRVHEWIIWFYPWWLLSHCLWIEFEDNIKSHKVREGHRKTGIFVICLTWWIRPKRCGKSTGFMNHLVSTTTISTKSECVAGMEVFHSKFWGWWSHCVDNIVYYSLLICAFSWAEMVVV